MPLSHNSNPTLQTRLAAWRQASCPEDVFGPLDPATPDTLKRRYRQLATQVHPDHHPNAKADATEAFRLLQEWYSPAQQRLAAGRYGTATTLSLFSGANHYEGDGPPLKGDLCDLYPAQSAGGRVLLKVARHARSNDLLQAEAQALRQLGGALAGQPLRAHFPTLVESFLLRDEVGAQRQTNVLCHETGYVTVAEVVAAYPDGIPAADMIWMWNRALAALGVAHSLGMVHGAVLPTHLLLRPSDHNGMLLDWCYSVPMGATIKAISPPLRAFYPPEVLAKQPASAATDLYMAAACMVHLLGGDVATQRLPPTVPRPIQALLRGCLIPSPARRANDGWELFEALRDATRRLYGPPTFRPFPGMK